MLRTSAAVACPDARYLVDDVHTPWISTVVLLAGRLSPVTSCARVGKLHRSHQGEHLSATLVGCRSGRRHVHLTAALDAACQSVSGVLRRDRGRPRKVRFTASRSECGDGRIDTDGGEDCEPALGCGVGAHCTSPACVCVADLPAASSTTTSSTTTSTLVRAPKCGDGHADPGESCDGSDLRGQTCPEGGILRCAPGCGQLDYSGCYACRNGIKEGVEECDGGDLGGATCDGPAESGGTPTCTGALGPGPACHLDHTSCYRCGNGRVDPGEDCDDGNAIAHDGCSPDCQLECGDGIVEPNEECDDGNQVDHDGCSSACFVDQQYTGGGNEPDDCDLEWAVRGATPAASVSCADGNPVCDQDNIAGQCTIAVGACLAVYPGLVGAPSCVPKLVTDVALVGDSLTGATALDAGSRAAFLDAMQTLLTLDPDQTVTRDDTAVHVRPYLHDIDICSWSPIVVPAGGARTLDVQAADKFGGTDEDRLTFTCTP